MEENSSDPFKKALLPWHNLPNFDVDKKQT